MWKKMGVLLSAPVASHEVPPKGGHLGGWIAHCPVTNMYGCKSMHTKMHDFGVYLKSHY